MYHDGSSKKLCAAVTVTGAVLWLTSTAIAAKPSVPDQISLLADTARVGENGSARLQSNKPLPQRVEEIREKVRAVLDRGSAPEEVQNIVQFFNFLNCNKNPKPKGC
jgi:hypothetical protein